MSNTEKIVNVMSKVFEVDISSIPLDATPDKVENWDSMNHMNLILALEEEFEITFSEEQIIETLSLEQFSDVIGELVNG